MKKQTKVLLAAAMMTMGATFTSMAATYDWQMEDGQWVCYDEDGEVYEDEWVESAGKDYYVGDDGILVTSEWIDGYYVDSTGAKTVNAWKYLLPEDTEEDDEDATEKWFYFGSKGTTKKNKQVIDGVTYYFDNETGEMLTGWVDYTDSKASAAEEYNGTTVYTDENGARVAKTWINVVEPGVDEEEEDEPDYYWYYISSKGKPSKGRQLDINGETYFFDAEGRMLSGWVATTNAEAFFDLAAEKASIADLEGKAVNVYFCGSEDQGWAKKSTWIKEYASDIYEDADADDNDKNWFWFNDKGRMYAPTSSDVEEVTFVDGAAENPFKAEAKVGGATKEINKETYVFNNEGKMLSGLVNIDGAMYYFGDSDDGAMKTGNITLADDAEDDEYKFFFGKSDDHGYTKGVAVTGAASGDLYINGLLRTSDDDYEQVTVKIGAKEYKFAIDSDGDIKTSKKEYLDEDDKVLFEIPETAQFETKGAFKGGIEVK